MTGNVVVLMKFGDDIKGHSTHKGYEDWIHLDSINFGAQRHVTQSSGVSNRNIGTPTVSTFSATKKMCPASAKLFLETLAGKAQDCKIHLLSGSSDGKQLNLVMEYTLRNAFITSHTSNVAAGSDAVVEGITVCCDAINGVYTPYNAKGEKGSPFAFGYDIATGTKT
ncbi:MAG: type VI secretion system tube protein Hcp [Bdellovibrionota bacterium]